MTTSGMHRRPFEDRYLVDIYMYTYIYISNRFLSNLPSIIRPQYNEVGSQRKVLINFQTSHLNF